MKANYFSRVVLLASAAFTATTSAVYGYSLSDEANQADLIVIGTVNAWTESATAVSFDIAVQSALKGSAPSATIHVAHQWSRPGGVFIGTPTGQRQGNNYGIWCLLNTGSSSWDVLPAHDPRGFMPSLYWAMAPSLPSAYTAIAAANLTDNLVVQVAAGLEFYGSNPEELLGATGATNSPALQAVFAHYLASPVPKFRAVGLAGMLGGSQTGAVQQLAQLSTSLATDWTRGLVVSALRNSFRDPTPSSVTALVQLANTSSGSAPDLRSAAIWALSWIHTKESLPFLASLLSSPDPAEQAAGVTGLASFANGCPTQTPSNVKSMGYLQFNESSPYKTDQTVANFAFGTGSPTPQLITFWTNWWSTNQASIMGSSAGAN